MARYLLGANALIDMCYQGTPTEAWIASVRPDELRMSAISVAIAREVMARHAKNPAEAGRLKQAFESRLALLINGRALVLPFSHREAAEWQTWRSHAPLDIDAGGLAMPVGQDTRMVIATAFANGFQLVEPEEPYHDELRYQGLSVLSL